MRTAALGNKLFRAEHTAFLYSELSRENISNCCGGMYQLCFNREHRAQCVYSWVITGDENSHVNYI